MAFRTYLILTDLGWIREGWNVCTKMHGVAIQEGRFLRILRKVEKATVTFVMSVRLSGRPHGTTRLPPDGKSVQKIQIVWKSGVQGSGGVTWGKETIGETQTQMRG